MEQREDNKNDIASRRLKNLFGEALGDLSSVEETENRLAGVCLSPTAGKSPNFGIRLCSSCFRGITFVLGLFSGKLSIPRSRSVCFCKFA